MKIEKSRYSLDENWSEISQTEIFKYSNFILKFVQSKNWKKNGKSCTQYRQYFHFLSAFIPVQAATTTTKHFIPKQVGVG
jgi:hypothetical protein